MVVPNAAIMMIVELMLELKESEPELALRVAKRFRALENDDVAKNNPESMELVLMVAKEIERE